MSSEGSLGIPTRTGWGRHGVNATLADAELNDLRLESWKVLFFTETQHRSAFSSPSLKSRKGVQQKSRCRTISPDTGEVRGWQTRDRETLPSRTAKSDRRAPGDSPARETRCLNKRFPKPKMQPVRAIPVQAAWCWPAERRRRRSGARCQRCRDSRPCLQARQPVLAHVSGPSGQGPPDGPHTWSRFSFDRQACIDNLTEGKLSAIARRRSGLLKGGFSRLTIRLRLRRTRWLQNPDG